VASRQRGLLAGPDGGSRHVKVAIVGSGFAGLCMAIKLRRAGIEDFVMLERSDAVGGTWRDNTYPGCACDVPSHLYSYSFETAVDWPRPYAEQADIRAYTERCFDKYGVRPFVQLNAELQRAVFDEARHHWQLTTAAGELTADVLVLGTGGLSNPNVPDLPGLPEFQGEAFHSARWNHDYDFHGKRVAVIGSGASTIQFLPQIAPLSQHVTLFQRTPPWVLPKSDTPFSPFERWCLRKVPFVRRMYRRYLFSWHETLGMAFRKPRMMRLARRAGERHIRQHIADPQLRALLTPDYIPGCKRILLSNDYYPALARDNVAVTGSPIREVRAHSIVTEDGQEHPVDVIVFGTGFDPQRRQAHEQIIGRDGVDLAEQWRASAEAYLGTLIAGFPNLFMLGGPNSGLGHNSMLVILEGAVRQTVQALALMERRGATSLEVKREAQDAYNADLQRRLSGSVWNSGCASWYLNDQGKNTAIWPGSAASYARATRVLDERAVSLGYRDADAQSSRDAVLDKVPA